MPSGIYLHKPLSEEHKRKIGLKSKGNKYRLGKIPWNKGKKNCYTLEIIKKMVNNRKNRTAWNIGLKGYYHHTEEWRKKVSEIHKKLNIIPPSWKGKKRSPESVEKSAVHRRGKHKPEFQGENNPLWKGGITPLHLAIRTLLENKNWIKAIFKKDNYTCQECFEKGCKLEAHHKKAFSVIFKEFLQLYNQFSPIEDKETLARLAITYQPFWDLTNGKTLCKKCHNETKKLLMVQMRS